MDSKSLQTMRASGLLCDCTIQIGDEQLQVHGVLMASRSDYFRSLLNSRMKDANLVDLSNMPANHDTINLIVDFCYGIPVQDRLDESNIGHVLCAASYLQMSGHNNLTEICEDKLRELTEQNLTSCLTILYNCTDIGVVAEREGVTEKCVEAAVRHFKSYEEDENGPSDDLCKSLNFENLPIRWMEQILEIMQQSECNMSMITFVSTACVTSIINCYDKGNQMEENSPYSLDPNRPSAASSTTLLEAFETIMSYVPDEASTLGSNAAVPIWFPRALEFATTHSQTSAGRIFSMCASIYEELADINDDDIVVYKLKPNIIIELNRVTQANHSNFADCVEKVTDRYLLVQVRHRSLTPSDFVHILQSTDWCSRDSFDAPFVALIKMLEIPQDVMKINEDEIAHMVANIDFTKLNQDMLERAATDTRIPRQVVVMAAVNVCSTLRSQLAITSKALTDEQKKTETFKSALDTANQRIRLLQAENQTLQTENQTLKTQLQIEEQNKKMAWVKTINGCWTAKHSGRPLCAGSTKVCPKQTLSITAYSNRFFPSEIDLAIRDATVKPVHSRDQGSIATFPPLSNFIQISKIYFVVLPQSRWTSCPFILVNETSDQLLTPNVVDDKIDYNKFTTWGRS